MIYNFTPQYLEELYIKQQNTLDEKLVEYVQEKILSANALGETYLQIAFRATVGGEILWEHFRGLGFYVSSSGHHHGQHDSAGNEIYYVNFNWETNKR